MTTLQQLSELILMEEIILSGYSWWWSYYYCGKTSKINLNFIEDFKNLLWRTVSFMKLITLKYGHVDTTFGPSSPDFPLLVLFSSRTYLSLSCFHLFSITSTDSSFSYRRKLIWAHRQSIYTVLYYIPVLRSSSMHLSSQWHHDKTVMTLATNKDKVSLLQLAFHRHPSITALLNDLLKNGHSVSTDYATGDSRWRVQLRV